MFKYPASASYDEENDLYAIGFRDFPTLHTETFTGDDIELAARDALTAAIGDSIDARLPIPEPSQALNGEILIHIPVLTCLKAALHNAMIETDTRKAELARKLNLNGPQIDRLFDVEYASKVETLEQALYLLGREVLVSVKVC